MKVRGEEVTARWYKSGEQPFQREAFERWYRMEIRNLDKLTEELKKEKEIEVQARTLREWKRKFNWESRAVTRERMIRFKTDERVTEEVAKMNARHIHGAIVAQDRAVDDLLKRGKSFRSPKDAVTALKEAVGIERTARGETSSIQGRKIEGTITIEEMQKAFITVRTENVNEILVAKEVGDGRSEGKNPGTAERRSKPVPDAVQDRR